MREDHGYGDKEPLRVWYGTRVRYSKVTSVEMGVESHFVSWVRIRLVS